MCSFYAVFFAVFSWVGYVAVKRQSDLVLWNPARHKPATFPSQLNPETLLRFVFICVAMPRSLRSAVCSQRVVATRSDPGREHLHTAAPYHVLTSGSHVVHAERTLPRTAPEPRLSLLIIHTSHLLHKFISR